jgi:hypothetical protein
MPTLTSQDWQREQKLPYDFDPTHDYREDVNRAMPEWKPTEYKTDNRWPGAAFPRNTRPHTVRDKDGVVHTIPAIRYVRFVDHAGNIHPLSISSVPAGPGPTEHESYEDGFDKQGTENRVMHEKARRGNLILELGTIRSFGPGGITGQEYLCWALAVADDRRRRHADYEAGEAEYLMTQAQRKMLDLQKEQHADREGSEERLATLVAKAVAEVLAAGKGKGKGKSGQEVEAE